GGIPRYVDPPLKAQETTRKDDLPAPADKHFPSQLPGQDKSGIQVDGKDLIPIFAGMLRGRLTKDHTGIVDQDVDDGVTGFDATQQVINGSAIGQIGLITREPAAQRPDL